MSLLDLVLRALGNLRRNKIRTLLTSASVAVGALTLVLTFGLSSSVNTLVSDQLSSSVENVELYIEAKTPESETNDSGVREYKENQQLVFDEFSGQSLAADLLEKEDITSLSSVSENITVFPNYEVAIDHISNGNTRLVVDDINAFVANGKAEHGQIPARDAWGKNEVALSFGYGEGFGSANSELIGSTLTLSYVDAQGQMQNSDVTVVATLESTNGLGGGDSLGNVIASSELLEEIYDNQSSLDADYNQFVGGTVVLADARDESAVRTAISERGEYEITSLGDIVEEITSTLDVITYGLLGFGFIALAAAAFGIVNTQLMSVYERTREIGLFKALGMSNKSVGSIFAFEATWVGIIGGLLGLGGALLIQVSVNAAFGDSLTAFNGSIISIQPLDAARVVGGLALMSFLAGSLPSRKASKLDPITALRDE